MGVTREADHELPQGIDSIMFHGVLSPEAERDKYRMVNAGLIDNPLALEASTGTDALKPETKHRRRGRPRMNESEEMANDKRKRQIRLAQRAHRSRKEERMSFLESKVTELEQKMANIRRLCLGIRAAVEGMGALTTSLSLRQSLHHDMLQLLSITEVDPRPNDASSMEIPQMLVENSHIDIAWDDAILNFNDLTTIASLVSSDDQIYSGFMPNSDDHIYFDSLLGNNGLRLQSNLYPALQDDMLPHGSSMLWNQNAPVTVPSYV
ncbi:bZIP transcription factor [Aspergillus affinis]|uniref:bZIP transcription factor n=1 Tax=Aspergillus affinis TaxID=1070780 RepID=UPI0022FE608B|nr:uncharacterized protein KD926_011258 [Aspergillus affinis]KAI9038124.1 hypothetical protein KD926_011258 [Aspergillus affinis]